MGTARRHSAGRDGDRPRLAPPACPGLIDNHTHVLLQGDITAADYDEQLLKESIPYRAIRATVGRAHRAR